MVIGEHIKRSDMISCVLCEDAPCSIACEYFNPGDMLRSIWFDDQDVAALKLPEGNICANCSASCEKECISKRKVPIRELMRRLCEEVRPEAEIPIPEDENRLECDICGVPLENPFLLSSSVVASTYDMCARAFEVGWAGVCFKTICSFKNLFHHISQLLTQGPQGSFITFWA